MKIALIEQELHIECLDSLCYYLTTLGHEVWVFTSTNIYLELSVKYPQCQWLYADDFEMRRFLPQINSCDIVIIETLQRDVQIYAAIRFTPPVIIRVHNINTWLRPTQLAWWQPLTFLKNLYHDIILAGEYLARQRILQNHPYLTFCDQPQTDYVLRHHLWPQEKIVELPAGVWYEELPLTHETWEKFTIVIPGTVEAQRRDYALVIAALKNLRQPVRLVLLGKAATAYAQDVIRQLQAIPHVEVVTFSTEVNQETFQSWLCTAQVLLAPLRLQTMYSCFTEVYGLTKSSGALNDAIRYAIPGIFPRDYLFPEFLRQGLLHYASAEELTTQLTALCDPEKYRQQYRLFSAIIKTYNTRVLQQVNNMLTRITQR